MNSEASSYEDIINLPHHVSKTRVPMSMHDRAAQFSPFAALTGYEDCIDETARITDERLEITEDRADMLNRRIAYLTEHSAERPGVIVEYFYPDEKKQGGRYITVAGNFRRIDEYGNNMVLVSGEKIPMGDIYSIDFGEKIDFDE